jgi:hypothetical protein
VTTGMNLEDVILSGRSQALKDKDHMISLYTESRKVKFMETGCRVVLQVEGWEK